MTIIAAMDSFKGSLSSMQAGEAVKNGILRALPDSRVMVRPLADGGEGTTDALIVGLTGRYRTITVTGPLGTPVSCSYGISGDGQTAILEMAVAAGLPMVPAEQRNPLYTTTFGVGEMILDAAAQGCREFLIGIGGSATNDGGAGMLQALGFGLYDHAGLPIPHGCAGLERLASISVDHVSPLLASCNFRIACDVTNPLCGEQGCSVVYGPQKGADEETIPQMDAALYHYAQIAKTLFPHADPDFPGAGAAGGLGFAFRTFLNGTLCSGAEMVLSATRLEDYIRQADLIITGEGRLDGQTAQGKGPAGVAQLAKKYGKPVIALVGCLGDGVSACHASGIDAFFPIIPGPCDLSHALCPSTAAENLSRTAEQVIRIFMLCSDKSIV